MIKMKKDFNQKFTTGFTLLELLIVIGILAILASITFVALNPAEQLKKARDSRRLSDLKSLDKAISIYESQTMSPITGSSTKVYLSLPDTSATCASYSLPPAPPGYSYACVTEANLRKTDSTGWVPVNFSSIAIGSPLSVLPQDPKNDATYYYTYVTGGSFMLSGLMESQGNKISDQAIADGGRMPGTFELGSDLSLGPFTRDNGLVGYWTFDEGTGTTAYDYSGQGNNGTFTGSPTWETSANCRNRGMCLGTTVNGVAQYASTGDPASGILDFSNTDSFSYSAWIKATSQEISTYLFAKGGTSLSVAGYTTYSGSNGLERCSYSDGDGSGNTNLSLSTTNVFNSGWHMVTCIMDTRAGKFSVYIDGNYEGTDISLTEGSAKNSTNLLVFGETQSANYEVDGYIDDVRIYNRALSAQEIQAIYNATK